MGKRNADTAAHSTPFHQESPVKRTKFETTFESPCCNDQNFALSRELVDGTILTDLARNKWRVGRPIGKGNFGEIFLASDDLRTPVTSENAKYVVKIEPHSNGPLFVEIHCLLNAGKKIDDKPLPPGMPEYIASGSHYFKQTKYRFLIIERFKCDLSSIIEQRHVDTKSLLVIAVQILDVLEHLHDRGYAHSDIKAENLMLGRCTFEPRKIDLSRLEHVADDLAAIKAKNQQAAGDEPDAAVVATESAKPKSRNAKKSTQSSVDSGLDADKAEDDADEFSTPACNRVKPANSIEFSGTNPVRSCRMPSKNSFYQDMVNTHYLRPVKKIAYFSDDDEDNTSDNYKNDRSIYYYPSTPQKRRAGAAHTPATQSPPNANLVTEDRIFIIDFGLAIKFVDSSGTHRPFCMDQRRAHDGTLEFTSRDAHMGAHSRRSDLEVLGYNLIYWLQGSLPWKDEKLMQQPEQVHRMKEYFMTDIRVMFQHVYGTEVPTFIGQFMEYVGGLAYHDRPDYNLCRCIFAAEMQRCGHNPRTDMRLSLADLRKRPRKLVKEMENHNLADKLKDVKSMMKLGMMMPFKETTLNRISPKNLRSKSDKLHVKKKSVFSWTDILSTDPDQIARQRAEKEFERDAIETPIISRYQGKPTYAILQVEKRLRFKDKLDGRFDSYVSPADSEESCSSTFSRDTYDSSAAAKPSTRRTPAAQQPATTDRKKRNNSSVALNQRTTAVLPRQAAPTEQPHPPKTHTGPAPKPQLSPTVDPGSPRRKSGLRRNLRPTEKSISYQKSVAAKKIASAKKVVPQSAPRSTVPNSVFSASDESCSSADHSNSLEDESSTSSSDDHDDTDRFSIKHGNTLQRYNSGHSSLTSVDYEPEEHDVNGEDYVEAFSPIKTRRKRRIAAFRKMAATIPLSDRLRPRQRLSGASFDTGRRIFTSG